MKKKCNLFTLSIGYGQIVTPQFCQVLPHLNMSKGLPQEDVVSVALFPFTLNGTVSSGNLILAYFWFIPFSFCFFFFSDKITWMTNSVGSSLRLDRRRDDVISVWIYYYIYRMSGGPCDESSLGMFMNLSLISRMSSVGGSDREAPRCLHWVRLGHYVGGYALQGYLLHRQNELIASCTGRQTYANS